MVKDLTKTINHAISNVREKLARYDFKLPYVSYEIVDDDFKLFGGVGIARARGIKELEKAREDELNRLNTKTTYTKLYNVNVSDDAVKQFNKIMFKKISELDYLKGIAKEDERLNKDIVIYKYPMNAVLEQYGFGGVDAVLAHEIWHVVEINKNIAHQYPMITECTATFVQNLLYPGKIKDPSKGILAFVYSDEHAKKVLSAEKNPIKALFDKDIRERISNGFIGQIGEFYTNNGLADSLKDIFIKAWDYLPGEVKELTKATDHNSLINIYRKIGACKLADELQNQDTRKIVDYYTDLFRRVNENKSSTNNKIYSGISESLRSNDFNIVKGVFK